MDRKKGSGQIEIILSFVIFTGFVVFLFAVFPVYRTEKSSAGLDSAEKSILDNVSVKIDYFTIAINVVLGGEDKCICFRETVSGNIIAKDIDGKIFNAEYRSDNVCINGKEYFFQIYAYDGFAAGAGVDWTRDCKQLAEPGDYTLGLRKNITMVSYDKLAALKQGYGADYSGLLETFNLPKGENFGFRLVDLKGTEILGAVRSIPQRVEVQARNVPVQAVYSNGEFKFAMLNVLEW